MVMMIKYIKFSTNYKIKKTTTTCSSISMISLVTTL